MMKIFLAAIVMASREVRRNVFRSSLTVLGIVIGVASVIAMVSLGRSASAKVTADVKSMGTNMIMLMPGAPRKGPGGGSGPPFTPADVKAIIQQVPGALEVAPESSKSALVVYGNRNHTTPIRGSTNAWLVVRGWTIAEGRVFSDGELGGANPACIIGSSTRKELFGGQSALGENVRVGTVTCRIIGLFATKGRSGMGDDQDDVVLMPLRVFQRRIRGSTDVGSIFLTVRPGRSQSGVVRSLELLMRERRHIGPGQEDDFHVADTKEFAKALSSVTATLTALLGGIASVSLLVGGIGIMNIMLVSVTERTREIGIRLSIGARGREVLLQFLVEAVGLSLLGGLVGLVVGGAGSYAATRALGMPFAFPPEIAFIAFVFSGAVGVLFGYLPARKAARMNPIEALRHE
jgi:putative ABC transport system permease protein